MLKLGGYGIIRSILIIMDFSIKYNFIFVIIRLLGIIYLRLVCLRQFDIKIIVAYSSVVHIGIILIGLISINLFGYYGGLLIILGHGLCSSAIFIIINFFFMSVLKIEIY